MLNRFLGLIGELLSGFFPKSDTVDRALIIEYSEMLHEQAQQVKARLRPFVRIKQMSGDLWAYDGLNAVEAVEVAGRVQATTFQEIEHTRRKISRRRFVVTLPIDSSDIRGMLMDPEGPYARECMKALERKFDRVGYDAMFANVSTGRDFETSVTFANDGGTTVTATAGLTYEKLLEIKQNFMDDEVGNDSPVRIVLGFSGDEHTALMGETELISGDFSRQFAIDNGEIVRALGMELIFFGGSVNNPLLTVSAGTRDNFALAERGLCYGMSKEMSITIKDRPDFIETKQVQILGQFGAVRTEGVLLQKVTTTDT